MRATLVCALLAGCGADRCAVRDMAYNGERCVELTNGRIAVVVAPRRGGRIVQLRFDGHDYLRGDRDLAGGGPADCGGDELRPAPADPRGPETGAGRAAWDLQILANHSGEAAVRLTSPEDPAAGIRLSREIRLRPRRTSVDLVAAMDNIAGRPVRSGIRQVTRHGGGPELRAWAPVYRHTRYPQGYRVLLGPEDNPHFTTIASPGGRLFRLECGRETAKAALDVAAEWLAVTDDAAGYLYAHTFPAQPGAEYPDGASVAFTTRPCEAVGPDGAAGEPPRLESEVSSPYITLAPGSGYAFATRLHLGRGAGPVYYVTENTAIFEPPAWSGGALAGKLVFFRDGRLFLAGAPLRSVRAGELLDLAAGAVAAGSAPAPVLLFVMEDAYGQTVQEIPIAPPAPKAAAAEEGP